MRKKQAFLSFAAVAVLISGSGFGIAGAQYAPMNTTPSVPVGQMSVQQMVNYVNLLKLQVQALQLQIALKQMGGVVAGASSASGAGFLTRTLQQGDRGNDVVVLQALLASDASVYPEGLITGYFGPLTASAVARYNTKNGMEAVGVVGAQTLTKLQADAQNRLNLEVQANGTWQACAAMSSGLPSGWLRIGMNGLMIVPVCRGAVLGTGSQGSLAITVAPSVSVGQNGATISWTTNANASSRVYYGTGTPLNLMGAANVTGASSANHSISINNLSPNTPYYFVVESIDAAGNRVLSSEAGFTTSASTGSGTGSSNSLAVSGVSWSNVSNNSAMLNWTSNANASGRVFYGTTSPLNTSSSASVNESTSASASNHSLILGGLNPNTTYYFMIESKDAAGNTVMSPQFQFTTTGSTSGSTGAGPAISNIAVSSNVSSTATITWNTNVPATTKIYLSTSAGVNTATATNITDNTFVTSHFANITGLSASTPYYYVIEARDASGNVSMTSEQQFMSHL